jgi:hypothetical protein
MLTRQHRVCQAVPPGRYGSYSPQTASLSPALFI